MSEMGRTVSRNIGILGIRQIFTWGSTFLLLLFLPRILGPVSYGKFSLGQSLNAIFALLTDFGGQFWLTKAVARNRESGGQIMADAFALRVILWVVSFTTMNVYALIAGYDEVTCTIILIFGIALIWNTLTGLLWNTYQGFEQFRYPAYSSAAASAFISGVGIFFLLHGVGPIGFTVVTTLGGLTSFLVCAFFIRRVIPIIPKPNWHNVIPQLKAGIPYFLNAVFGVIYYRNGIVMLSLLASESAVGWYGASYRFFESVMFVPSIFTISIFPALSRRWGEKKVSIGRSVQKSLDFMFILGVPIAIGIFGFSDEIITFFYGLKQYHQSVLLLKIFSLGMLIVYIDNMLGTALLASDRQRQLTIIGFCAILINVGINYLLIPYTQNRFGNGGIGSAIATVATEFFIMICMGALLQKSALHECKITAQIKVLLAGCAMAGSLWFAMSLGLHWLIRGSIASAVYLGIFFVLKTLEPSDIELIKAMIPKRFLPKKKTMEID